MYPLINCMTQQWVYSNRLYDSVVGVPFIRLCISRYRTIPPWHNWNRLRSRNGKPYRYTRGAGSFSQWQLEQGNIHSLIEVTLTSASYSQYVLPTAELYTVYWKVHPLLNQTFLMVLTWCFVNLLLFLMNFSTIKHCFVFSNGCFLIQNINSCWCEIGGMQILWSQPQSVLLSVIRFFWHVIHKQTIE